ncbi:trypsin-like serine peptidase [Microbispora rosea]|uniref:trypsin-like serine peptidase n=1 Tax=Microbispora rosea TaxID=58117 RepID=UPI0004C3CFC8|nr:hypothetical protein [Microbispora rosea]
MKRTLALGGVAVGLLATALVASPAHADRGHGKPKAKPLAETNFAAKQVAAFWFGEKMANLVKATPYETETKVAAKHVSTMPKEITDTKPGVVSSSGDKKTTSTSKNVNLPRTTGKVFFIGTDNKPHWCTATALQSLNKNLVATAGHCVYDTVKDKDLMDKWVFVPGYYNGKTPYGIYVGKMAFTHFDYTTYGDGDFDYAFVAVYNGVTPTDAGASGKYESQVYKSKWDAERAKAKLAADKTTALSKLDVVEVNTLSSRAPEVPVSVAEFQAWNKGKNLTGNGPWAPLTSAGAINDKVQPNEYRSDRDSYVSRDGKTLFWRVKQQSGNHEYKYYSRTFKAKAFKGYKVVGAKLTIGLKDVGKLGDNVGGQGLAYNQKVGQPTFVFGYPSGSHPDGNYAFSGKTLKYSYGKTFPATASALKGEALQGIKSSFTGEGASGSAWLYKYNNSTRFGYLNGVTIGVSDTDGNNRYDTSVSPYFDGETLAVYKTAAATPSSNIV